MTDMPRAEGRPASEAGSSSNPDDRAQAADGARTLDRLYRRFVITPLVVTLLCGGTIIALRLREALADVPADPQVIRLCAVALMISVPMLLLLRLNRRIIRAGIAREQPR